MCIQIINFNIQIRCREVDKIVSLVIYYAKLRSRNNGDLDPVELEMINPKIVLKIVLHVKRLPSYYLIYCKGFIFTGYMIIDIDAISNFLQPPFK